MYPRMGLLLSDAGMDAVRTTYVIEELLGCRAKRAEHRETKGHEIEAGTGTGLRVLVPVRLVNRSQCRGGIPPAPPGQRDTDQVHATVAIATPTIQKDVGGPSEPRTATGLGILIA